MCCIRMCVESGLDLTNVLPPLLLAVAMALGHSESTGIFTYSLTLSTAVLTQKGCTEHDVNASVALEKGDAAVK